MNKYGKVKSTAIGSVSALVLCATSTVRAADELHLGPVKIHPHLDFSATYDDNIFIRPEGSTNNVDDFYFVISPGVSLLYGDQKRNFLSLDYTAGIQRFVEHTGEDTVNHTATFNGGASSEKVDLKLTHAFTDIRGANTEVADRVRELRNVTQGSAEYRLSAKTSVGVNYRQELHDYGRTSLIDWQLYEPGGTLYYHVTPKTHVFSQFDYGWVNVDQGDNDSQFQEINLGIRTLPGNKLIGTVKGGFQHRDFDGPTDTINAFVASALLEANFSEHTSAELSGVRNINPSVTATDNNYTLTRITLTLREKLWKKKVVISVSGGYERDDYDKAIAGVERRDDYWEAGAGVDYNITSYFQVGASHRYRKNDSTIDSVSFDENISTVHLLLHF